MPLIGESYPDYEYSLDEPSAIVGELVTGISVTIELWVDGVIQTVTSSTCTEIGNTGRFSWSLGNIPVLTGSRVQYHWRMSDGGANSDEGDFILFNRENVDGGMPSLNDKSSYIQQI